MLTYVDHVSLAVRNLDEAIAHLRNRLSLVVSRKRAESGSPLVNSVIPLLQGYIELVSIADPRLVPSHSTLRSLNAFLSVREGLFAFAIRSSNLAEDVRLLQTRGSRLKDAVHEPFEANGEQAGWWTSSLPDDAEPIFPFLIQYEKSPENHVRESGLSQPFAIRAIEEVTVVVPKLDTALEAYERDFGLTPGRQLGGRAQISLSGSKINLIPAKMTPLGTPAGLYSVGLGTTDINGARAALQARGVSTQPDPFSWGVASQIDPSEGMGARLDLVQL